MTEPTEHKYKRFLIFGFDSHYPGGGLGDVIGEADTFAEAQTQVSTRAGGFFDYYQVLDLQERIECSVEEP